MLQAAKESGAFKRQRKVFAVTFFWVLVLGFGVNFLRNLRAMKREYERKAATKLSISSFHDRFTPEMAEFFRLCVLHAIEVMAAEGGISLGKKLKSFKDLLIQDSTIIRLHESLSPVWPAARSRKVAAGIKVSCLVSAVANGMKSVTIFPERTSEIKTLRIGSWVKDKVLLLDLGFFKYGIFDKINSYGGYFVTRLKDNANPVISAVNSAAGIGIPIEGKRIKDVIALLTGGSLDVSVEADFRKRKYNGKRKKDTLACRLVAVLNVETQEYHLYMTNIPAGILEAKDIAALYGARWEIEMTFKELKSHYRLDMISSRDPAVIECLVWIAILTLMCSRRLHTLVRNANPRNAYRYTHILWAKVFMENANDQLDLVIRAIGIHLTMIDKYGFYLDQSLDPNVCRRRLLDGWIE